MESATSLDTLATAFNGLGHPVRLRALVLLEFEASPTDLAEVLDVPLGLVSYHVRMLRDYGLVAVTRTEHKRGAVKHYYERTELADHVLGTVNGLLNMPARKRGRQGQQRWAALASWAVESQAAA
jgi:DNA-binding transcriptional ArsR family regulator